jgi:enoyl-CoA hydratase/carnithine racemase
MSLTASDSAAPVRVERPSRELAIVTIARPQRRNALNAGAWQALRSAFEGLATDGEGLRAVVLTGSGGHFCAGDDVVDYAAVRGDLERERAYGAAIEAVYAAIRSAPFPVFAVVQGACVGGGCSLAMACDFRIGHREARVGITAARLGVAYPVALTRRLASLVGLSVARRWLFEGELFNGEQAHAVGFLDALVDDPLGEALGRAQRLGACAPLSVAAFKAQLNALQDDALVERSDEITDRGDRATRSSDAVEAARAFREKRAPVFEGR